MFAVALGAPCPAAEAPPPAAETRQEEKGDSDQPVEAKLTVEQWREMIQDMLWLRGFMERHRPPFHLGPPDRKCPERGGPPRRHKPRQRGRWRHRGRDRLPPRLRRRYEEHKKRWEELSELKKKIARERMKWLRSLPEEDRERVINVLRRVKKLSMRQRAFLHWMLDLPPPMRENILEKMAENDGELPPVPSRFRRDHRGRGPGPWNGCRRLLDKLTRWDELPQAEREKLPEVGELTPEQRNELIDKLRGWKDLSDEECEKLKERIKSLVPTPPWQPGKPGPQHDRRRRHDDRRPPRKDGAWTPPFHNRHPGRG